MSMYYEGMDKVLSDIERMDKDDLIQYMSGLHGHDHVYPQTLENLRAEARRQCREDHKNVSSPHWETVDFFSKVMKAG